MTDATEAKRAEEYGRQARRGGRNIGANPYRGSTPLVRSCSAAWLRGWQAQNSAGKVML